MIHILHIADLHFGLEFSRYPAIAHQLKEDRLNALRLTIQRANQEGVHAIVVAGDLFDKLTVPQRLVKDVKSAFAQFSGDVLVIPGNHDWYNASANENKLWNWFKEAPGDNVHFLNQWKPYRFSLNSQEVVFYPCGCHQKHSAENLLSWVKDAGKAPEYINIGIAHGNVEGYGLDEEGNYFPMSPDALKEAGMDCWLLGHIHAPYPNSDSAGHEVFFFAGNHSPDSWKSERTGGAWLIEISDDKKIKGTRWNSSGIQFKDRYFTINNLTELQSATFELNKMNPEKTVLRLTLHGSLTEEELLECRKKINEITQSFLHYDPYWKIGIKITSESINKLFVKDSIPYALLTKLSQNEEDSLAMQLAFQTIKDLSI